MCRVIYLLHKRENGKSSVDTFTVPPELLRWCSLVRESLCHPYVSAYISDGRGVPSCDSCLHLHLKYLSQHIIIMLRFPKRVSAGWFVCGTKTRLKKTIVRSWLSCGCERLLVICRVKTHSSERRENTVKQPVKWTDLLIQSSTDIWV